MRFATPLNTMNVTLGLLKRRVAGNKEVMALADTISVEILQLDHFLSDFLNYSRQPPAQADADECQFVGRRYSVGICYPGHGKRTSL